MKLTPDDEYYTRLDQMLASAAQRRGHVRSQKAGARARDEDDAIRQALWTQYHPGEPVDPDDD